MTENDRLVHQHANGYIKPTQYGHTRYWSNASKFDMMNRLGEYEDTGLTPDEIMALLKERMEREMAEIVLPPDLKKNAEYYFERKDEYEIVHVALGAIDMNRMVDIPYWGVFSYNFWELPVGSHDKRAFYRHERTFGETWRCWTSRPTDEQREAEAWQD